ncbi:MAG: hypothetical protein ACRDRJ_05105 [Streptosporangiaceae bacterium]
MAGEALNPTIGGALIGGGVALIAVFASILGTAMTLRANRVAAHEQRIWEERAKVYEDLLRFTSDVRKARGSATSLDDFYERQATLAVRAQAYASDPVWRRYPTFALLVTLSSDEADIKMTKDLSMDLDAVIRVEMVGSNPIVGLQRLRFRFLRLTGRTGVEGLLREEQKRGRRSSRRLRQPRRRS